METTDLQSVDLGFCRVEQLSNTIVKVTYLESLLITAYHTKKVYDTCDRIMPGRYFFLLGHEQHVNAKFHPETLNMSADTKRAERVIADGFVPNNAGLKIMANFYLKMKRPKVPARAFSTADQAIEWFNSSAFNKEK